MNLRLVVACVAAMTAGVALAETYTWTGAENGFWTNANNWAEGTVPGRYFTPKSPKAAVGQTGDATIFGDNLTGAKVTTIDFDGVYSVSNITTTGSNRYTYGTGASQTVPIEPFGSFVAAERSDTPVAQLNAFLQLGVECLPSGWGGDTMHVVNNSTEELVIGGWGKCTKLPDSSASGGEPAVRFEGTGDFRFVGEYERGSAYWYSVGQFGMEGKLTVEAPLLLRRFDIVKPISGRTPTLEVEIREGASIEPISCYNYLTCNERDAHIFGAGTFKFGVGLRSKAGVICETSVSKTLTLACKVENKFIGGNPPDDFPNRIQMRGNGTIVFRPSENTIQGALMATNNVTGVYVGETIGKAGTFGSLGDVWFMLGDNAGVRFVGSADDTTDRAFVLKDAKTATGKGKIEQDGTGALTVESSVTLGDGADSGTFTLGGSSATPATFAGTLADGISVAKTGNGLWTFNPQGDFTDEVSVAGGTLAFGKAMSFSALKATSGTTVVIVPAGVTLEVCSLTADASKKIDVILSDATAKCKVTSGTLPTGVTINGHPAVLDGDNCLSDLPGSAHIYRAATDGNWSTANLWKWDDAPGEAPEKDVFIDAFGGDYTVTLDSSANTTNLTVKNRGAGTATLQVKETTLDVVGHTTKDSVLHVNAGGRLDVVDSTLRVKDLGNAQGDISGNSTTDFAGGQIVFRGSSTFINYGIPDSLCTSGKDQNRNTNFNFVDCDLTFDDDAVFKTETDGTPGKTVFYHTLNASAGKTAKLSFKGRSYPNLATPWTLYMGGAGHTILEFDSAYDKPVSGLWQQSYIGNQNGFAEILIKRGSYAFGTYDFFHLGTCTSDSTSGGSGFFTTGRVDIAVGASLKINGTHRGTTTFDGMGVGQGIAMQKPRGNSYLRGELAIHGTYTQGACGLYVGMGPCGDGDVFMDGGVANVVTDQTNADRTDLHGNVVFGAFGGVGRFRMTGGAFNTLRDVYVGGMLSTDVLGVTHKNAEFLDQQHDAQGTLAVSGGTFETKKNLIVGRDGTGAIELSGSGVVKAVDVTVGHTDGQPASSLSFTSDENGGFGSLVADSLDFAEGTKLTVDVAACPTAKKAKLIALANAATGRDNVTLELINADKEAMLFWSADGKTLSYRLPRGGVVILR